LILLDTNVLSELVKPRPDPRVVSWTRHSAAYSGEADHRVRSKVIMGSGDRDHLLAGCCGLTGGARERVWSDATGD
jgi:predicted nucleic acid-binding protein